MSVGAVVVAGGSAARMDGVDKASIELAGRTLIEYVLGALAEVPDVVVVGDKVTLGRHVLFTREEPAGGGPAAALLAGLRAFPTPPRQVVVLAVDMPRVTSATVRRLMLRADGDGAVLLDGSGRRQHLCAVYSTAALLAASPGPGAESGLSMTALTYALDLTEVPAVADEARDVDTWDDLRDLTH